MDDVPYLSDASLVRLRPAAADLIAFYRQKGFLVFVVTNQSGIARGKIELQELRQIHARVQEMLAAKNAEAKIDGVYFCPHHPQADLEEYRVDCTCRKPKPGLLLQACSEYEVDLENSLMVGDRSSDVQAGIAAGVRSYQVVEQGSEFAPAKEAAGVFASVAELFDSLKKQV
jgi:D-glycero-D-manno-heptose 1,7-bisphosphate phosphatase